MELGAILHVVASHRRLVAAGAAGTLAIGIVAGHGTTREAGVASANVVVDTRPSDFANSAPGGTDSLVWRAELLADLLTTESNRARVARAAGVPVDELAIVAAAARRARRGGRAADLCVEGGHRAACSPTW